MKLLLIMLISIITITNFAYSEIPEFNYESPKNVIMLLKNKTDKETMIKLTAIYITWITIAKSKSLYPESDRLTALNNAQDLIKEIKSDKPATKILKHQYKKNATVNLKDDSYYVSIIFPKNLIATAYGPYPPFPYGEDEKEIIDQ